MSSTAIVIGGAAGVWEDQREAYNLVAGDHFMRIACNHAIRDASFYIDHACSMHPDLMPKWIEARRAAGFPGPGQLWHPRHRKPVLESRAIESWGGSSGMLCVVVALELGCDRIILAGVPMDKMAGHYDNPKPWMEARQYHSAWERALPRFAGRVRSMSGWTRQLLGAPDREWLDGGSTRPA